MSECCECVRVSCVFEREETVCVCVRERLCACCVRERTVCVCACVRAWCVREREREKLLTKLLLTWLECTYFSLRPDG